MKPTILCVDDQVENLRVRTMLLEIFGCNTIAVSDGRSALHEVETRQVDLLLIDYHLAHGESGEDLARAVTSIRPDLPMIMLTGDNKLPQSAIDAVDGVLIKGASDPRAMIEMLQRLLPNAEIRSPRPMLFREKPKQGS